MALDQYEIYDEDELIDLAGKVRINGVTKGKGFWTVTCTIPESSKTLAIPMHVPREASMHYIAMKFITRLYREYEQWKDTQHFP